MTTNEAVEKRREIVILRGRRRATGTRGLPGAMNWDTRDRLWQTMQQMYRELEDAGEPTYVDGEWE